MGAIPGNAKARAWQILLPKHARAQRRARPSGTARNFLARDPAVVKAAVNFVTGPLIARERALRDKPRGKIPILPSIATEHTK